MTRRRSLAAELAEALACFPCVICKRPASAERVVDAEWLVKVCGKHAALLDASRCTVHGRPLICPACVGARGGKVGGKALTPAKLRQLRRAAKRPRPGARKVEA